MNIEIDSYEAKIRLPELLLAVRTGKRYTITLCGEPIADLVPAENNKGDDAAVATKQMRELMLSAAPIKDVGVDMLINEGRT